MTEVVPLVISINLINLIDQIECTGREIRFPGLEDMKSLIVITLKTLTIDSTLDRVAKDSSIRMVVTIPRVTIIRIDKTEIIAVPGTVQDHFSLFRGIKLKIWADRFSIGWWCL